MSKKNWSNILSVLAHTVLAFAFVLGQTAWAGQGQNVTDKSSSNGAAKAPQAPPNLSTAGSKAQPAEEKTATAQNSSAKEDSQYGGQHEGITVHGHWSIEVRNADGTLATHREFENSLAGGGSYVLSTLLSRTNSVGLWEINLQGPANGGPCPGSANNSDCVIQESLSPYSGAGVSNGLTVMTTTGAGGLNVLQLSGTAVAGTGQITAVQTVLNACPTGSTTCAPQTLAGNIAQGYLFTQAVITPVNVLAGQTVAVTVVISFS